MIVARIAALALLTGLRADAEPPNVLFIACDDLRPELGCYGADHMHTPHIDALAAQGRLFRNHYVAVPTCGASRYALMSGLRPTAATDGNDAFGQMPNSLPSSPESWVDLLRRGGWHTVSLGKVTHEPDGYRWNDPGSYDIGRSSATWPDMRFSWNEILFEHGKWGAQRYPLFAYADGSGRVRNVSPAFEEGMDHQGNSLPDEAYPDGRMAAAAIDKLREFADDGRRFCLAIGFHKPHLPFNAPKSYFDLYDPATLPAPFPLAKPAGANPATTTDSGEPGAYSQSGDRARLRHAYFACISYVDAQVGKVLGELDALGLTDNTVVVLWGDHGWCLDDYSLIGKHKVLERALEAPLIIRPPTSLGAAAFAGVPADGVVETIDLYPTLAELCGLEMPDGPDGCSLVPMLRNPFVAGKSHAYSRFGGASSVRTPEWRLIQAGGDHDLYDLSEIRYELRDISSIRPEIVDELAPLLDQQGKRPGTTYQSWSEGHPELSDPNQDADGDGASNGVEYGSGSDAFDPASKPVHGVSIEDLSDVGLSEREVVFGFSASTLCDDLAPIPMTSANLRDWSPTALVFLEALDGDVDQVILRFRLGQSVDPARFFSVELAP